MVGNGIEPNTVQFLDSKFIGNYFNEEDSSGKTLLNLHYASNAYFYKCLFK